MKSAMFTRGKINHRGAEARRSEAEKIIGMPKMEALVCDGNFQKCYRAR